MFALVVLSGGFVGLDVSTSPGTVAALVVATGSLVGLEVSTPPTIVEGLEVGTPPAIVAALVVVSGSFVELEVSTSLATVEGLVVVSGGFVGPEVSTPPATVGAGLDAAIVGWLVGTDETAEDGLRMTSEVRIVSSNILVFIADCGLPIIVVDLLCDRLCLIT